MLEFDGHVGVMEEEHVPLVRVSVMVDVVVFVEVVVDEVVVNEVPVEVSDYEENARLAATIPTIIPQLQQSL